MSSVLCVVAHPDDETMLSGGTLALLAAQKVAVHVVSLTRGEGGELGEPPLTTRDQLGDVREAELVCAVGKLGGRSLSFLGYVDPTVGPGDELFAPAHDPTMLSGQIATSIKQVQAQVVLTHGSSGEYGHPAHQLVHNSVLIAAASLGAAAPLVYSFAAAYPAHPYPRLANATDPADVIVDIAAFMDKKIAAALCHATQTPLFVRRRSEAAGRALTVAEVLLPEESFHRQWPGTAPAADPFLDWVKPYARRA